MKLFNKLCSHFLLATAGGSRKERSDGENNGDSQTDWRLDGL